jgi:hypothetical protein
MSLSGVSAGSEEYKLHGPEKNKLPHFQTKGLSLEISRFILVF